VPLLFRAAGYCGWCILLDELELIGRYTPLQRALSYAWLGAWLGLEGGRRFPGIVTAYAITDDFVTATRGAALPETDEQRALLARSETLVDELLAADVIVIAAPMINFTIPSNLKAWIDYVARAGRTFSYSEAGPKGLVTGKHAILVAARGGVYANNPALDFQVPYLKGVLAFLGITDVEVLEVEGTAYGPEAVEKAVAAASLKLQSRCNALAAAA